MIAFECCIWEETFRSMHLMASWDNVPCCVGSQAHAVWYVHQSAQEIKLHTHTCARILIAFQISQPFFPVIPQLTGYSSHSRLGAESKCEKLRQKVFLFLGFFALPVLHNLLGEVTEQKFAATIVYIPS